MQLPNTASVVLVQPHFGCSSCYLVRTRPFVPFFHTFLCHWRHTIHFIYLLHFNINYGPTHHARVSVAQHMAVALVSSWPLYKLWEITASDWRASQSVHKTESISEDKCKKKNNSARGRLLSFFNIQSNSAQLFPPRQSPLQWSNWRPAKIVQVSESSMKMAGLKWRFTVGLEYLWSLLTGRYYVQEKNI